MESTPLRANLSKRLLGYSATVAACVAAAPDSEAVVIYNDFADVTLDATTQAGSSHKMSFDIDGDGAADIQLAHYSSTFFKNPANAYSAGLGQPDAFSSDRVAADGTFYPYGGTGNPGAARAYPLRYTAGQMISPTNAGFTANAYGPGFGMLARLNGPFYGAGSHWYFDGSGNEFLEGYLGIRFFSSSAATKAAHAGLGADVFGWVRIRVAGDSSTTPSPFSITILDAAYEASGGAITAGAIPEPGSLGLLALGALGLMGTRRRRSAGGAPSTTDPAPDA